MNENFGTSVFGPNTFPGIGALFLAADFGWRSASSATIKPYLLSRALAPEGGCSQTLASPVLPSFEGTPWNERRPTCI
jgi:hypothetical protein